MGFDVTIGGALGAGLLSFLSPCILPIVPFYLCYMAGLSVQELASGEIEGDVRRRLFLSSLMFSAGIITVFMLLGASASAIGQQFRDWFDFLQYVAGGLIIVLGLHFTGIARIPFLYREARVDAGLPTGYFSAFLVGLAFAFGWTPCVGPVLAAILFTAGAQETASEGAKLLFVYGAGMTLPFIVAAAFAKPFLTWVQRFKAHLGRVEKIMGGLLILFGVLIVTSSINVVAEWMLSIAPDIGTLQ